jgi:hypothetical protein
MYPIKKLGLVILSSNTTLLRTICRQSTQIQNVVMLLLKHD